MHFPFKLVIDTTQTLNIYDSFEIFFHAKVIVDMTHGLDHESDSALFIRMAG